MDSIINYQYAYVEIHFHPWFILFKKEKNFHIKTKENLQQNTEFPIIIITNPERLVQNTRLIYSGRELNHILCH